MSIPFIPQAFNTMLANFMNVLAGGFDKPINADENSPFTALGEAATANDSYLQGLALQIALAARLDTSTGSDLDTYVQQFTPPFSGRIQAVTASTAPVSPTTLQADATANYLWVASIAQLVLGQSLTVAKNGYSGTTTIAAIQPTTTLTTAANQGDTTLNLTSTNGMFVNASLTLVDGSYSATVTITAVNSGNVTIQALTGDVSHTYATATTVVTLNNVLQINPFTFASGSSLANLTQNATVTATTLITGLMFSRKTSDGSSPTISVGYVVQTSTGIQFSVVADTTNANYSSTLQAYVMPATATVLYVSAQCTVAGSSGNVVANTLTVLPTPLNGIDAVTNPYSVTNGADAETDTALIARFKLFISSLTAGTILAVESAVAGAASGVQYKVLENVASDGVTVQDGHFTVIASDGNGVLSTSLYNAVWNAVNAVRPLTSLFNVVPPSLVTSSIEYTLSYDTVNYAKADVQTAVQNAVFKNFTNQAPGVTVTFSSLLKLALDTPGVLDVLSLTVNGNGFTKAFSTAISTPAAPAVAAVGTAGSTSYTYYIVAYDSTGARTQVSAATTITTGNATLSGSNYNQVSWTSPTGAAYIDVLRGDTGHVIEQKLPATTTSIDDTGLVAEVYAEPPFTLIGNGPADITAGALQLIRPPLASITVN